MMWVMCNLVSVHLETVSMSVQDMCTFCAKHNIGPEIVLDANNGTPWWRGSSGSSFSVCLEIVLILTQDSCMVCAERTIGSGSFWTHPMKLLGDEAQVVVRFGLFRDSANLDAR